MNHPTEGALFPLVAGGASPEDKESQAPERGLARRRDQLHPTPTLLLRFLLGEATLAERHAVVRHLLAGCRLCSAALRPAWGTKPARNAAGTRGIRSASPGRGERR